MKMENCLYRLSGLITMVSIFLLFTGCGSIRPDSSLASNWGNAYESQLKLQQANPEAGRQVRPVMEMDGASIDAIMEAHRQSFENGPKDESVNIIKLR